MQGQRIDTKLDDLKHRRLLEEKAPQIWLSFKQGNEDAFTELMELYYPSMLNYGLRFQNDRELVKDCIQDLFLELWKPESRSRRPCTEKLLTHFVATKTTSGDRSNALVSRGT